ncbi:uncharacterized protein LOC6036502 [Culex quinquefasciatus]|uniref:uncharacterized protein LOC6036502 n=1 Tax=Culex quinquefasciatus TaxID=7176 RepID=UPI0018E3E6AC|nr:uncharacterized protein LOC6036502 [Culex quinquefasciatus]
MLPRSLHSTLLACLLLASALSIEGAKRRSRLDLPISKPAEAPLEDNLATASGGSDPAYDRAEPPAAVVATSAAPAAAPSSTEVDTANSSGSGSSENSSQMIDEYTDEDCDPDFVAFELVTGYVFSAPNKLLDSIPGTLMLTDCLEACQSNDSCSSVNYETGLCVLFSSNSDKLPGALTKSQFPVFTIYAQKSCLKLRPCERAWCIDRVQGYKLNGHVKRTATVLNRRDCLEMCLGENEFTCRSANYYQSTNTCELSDMDRITLAGSSAFAATDGSDYLENNCAEEPTKLCEFKRMSGRILKTVDSVYQEVPSVDECRELCLSSPYRCHSYDYGDTGDMVCRLSHHSRATLADIQDPYLDVPEAATYELSSCYNVSIECRAGDMIAKIRTSKLFDGKVYAKGAPNSCSVDVKSALEFELRMGYQDIDCNVRQNGLGRYLNDVVIQHHDTIVTSSDLGLAVTCQYDLTNKTVSNDVDLDVTGDIEPALSEEVVVDSPNVVMKITSRDGSDMMRTAEVGDPLALRFEILDQQSPYEIFVRELVAMDGVDSSEITLINARGCPTDHFIMGPIYKSAGSGKILLSHFDAFKFPSSEMVQFRALVTPCMPTCEPVQCDQDDFAAGELRSIVSYGRKRRSVNATADFSLRRERRETTHQAPQDDMLLVQSIQITDKFGFEKQQQAKPKISSSETVFVASSDAQGICVNGLGLIVAAAVFLLGQLAVIAIWTFLWQRRRKQRQFEGASMGSSVMPSPTMTASRGDSMCKLYDSGYAGRHF